ncbi:peroxiredoxin [Clostridium sp.]|uniref:peroxiredoxin n=1 Tax=Clostridium sp. TaxID=1506 RepID=UPI002FDEB1A4
MENVKTISELKIGDKAPNFNLKGSDGKDHSLVDFLGKKVVLYFYPKDNTSGCTKEALCFIDNYENFSNLNTIILGISRDSLSSHDKFIKKLNIPYILLSDSEEVVCNLYGVLKEKNMYGKKSIGIERSTFIINEDGIIENIYRKVKVDKHVDNILSFLTK